MTFLLNRENTRLVIDYQVKKTIDGVMYYIKKKSFFNRLALYTGEYNEDQVTHIDITTVR